MVSSYINKMKNCIICNKKFSSKKYAYKQKCCSEECSDINCLNYQKKYRKENTIQIKKYRHTDKCKQSVKKYQQSDNYKKYLKEYKLSETNRQVQIKYWRSLKGKATLKRYHSSNGGKLARKLWRNTIVGKYSDLKRREAKYNCDHNFSIKEWKLKCEATNGICPCCNRYIGIEKMTMDHIYALMRAYEDFIRTGVKRIYTIGDVQPMCLSCNCSKSDKLMEEFELRNLNINQLEI